MIFPLRHKFSDAELVEGVFCKKSTMQKALFDHCWQYFDAHAENVFFASATDRDDIFQNTFITLWQNIEHRKIYVENGVVFSQDGLPFRGTVTSYFMGIARLKYMEFVRSTVNWVALDEVHVYSSTDGMKHSVDGEPITNEWLDTENPMWEVVAECVAELPERCYQILDLFYVQGKSLDLIMDKLTTFTSKDALKTAKNKCLTRLRQSAIELYKTRKI